MPGEDDKNKVVNSSDAENPISNANEKVSVLQNNIPKVEDDKKEVGSDENTSVINKEVNSEQEGQRDSVNEFKKGDNSEKSVVGNGNDALNKNVGEIPPSASESSEKNNAVPPKNPENPVLNVEEKSQAEEIAEKINKEPNGSRGSNNRGSSENPPVTEQVIDKSSIGAILGDKITNPRDEITDGVLERVQKILKDKVHKGKDGQLTQKDDIWKEVVTATFLEKALAKHGVKLSDVSDDQYKKLSKEFSDSRKEARKTIDASPHYDNKREKKTKKDQCRIESASLKETVGDQNTQNPLLECANTVIEKRMAKCCWEMEPEHGISENALKSAREGLTRLEEAEKDFYQVLLKNSLKEKAAEANRENEEIRKASDEFFGKLSEKMKANPGNFENFLKGAYGEEIANMDAAKKNPELMKQFRIAEREALVNNKGKKINYEEIGKQHGLMQNTEMMASVTGYGKKKEEGLSTPSESSKVQYYLREKMAKLLKEEKFTFDAVQSEIQNNVKALGVLSSRMGNTAAKVIDAHQKEKSIEVIAANMGAMAMLKVPFEDERQKKYFEGVAKELIEKKGKDIDGRISYDHLRVSDTLKVAMEDEAKDALIAANLGKNIKAVKRMTPSQRENAWKTTLGKFERGEISSSAVGAAVTKTQQSNRFLEGCKETLVKVKNSIIGADQTEEEKKKESTFSKWGRRCAFWVMPVATCLIIAMEWLMKIMDTTATWLDEKLNPSRAVKPDVEAPEKPLQKFVSLDLPLDLDKGVETIHNSYTQAYTKAQQPQPPEVEKKAEKKVEQKVEVNGAKKEQGQQVESKIEKGKLQKPPVPHKIFKDDIEDENKIQKFRESIKTQKNISSGDESSWASSESEKSNNRKSVPFCKN